MRVAFTEFGGSTWTGGLHYLENLVKALRDYQGHSLSPVLFAGPNADSAATRIFQKNGFEVVRSNAWSSQLSWRIARAALSFGLQRDVLAEREFYRSRIDVVFQHYAWYGWIGVPTVAWIADFQHRRNPSMFSASRFMYRDIGYRALARSATRILVSSEDAANDCRRFYPSSRNKLDVLPFAVTVDHSVAKTDLQELRKRWGIPEKFFYLPNQLWKHKNHIGVIRALHKLKLEGNDSIVVVSTGSASDPRHPDYPEWLGATVTSLGLKRQYMYLGMVPRADVIPLMCAAAAVLNPSLSEGWSTTVEEAKAVGVPLVLSNLPVHVEQAGGNASYFDPLNVDGLAGVLENAWREFSPGPRGNESKSLEHYEKNRAQFANSFAQITLVASKGSTK